MLSAKRSAKTAKRFSKRYCRPVTRVINVDKNAAYPAATDDLKAEESLPEETELRPVEYLNNLVEQDHRRIQHLGKPSLDFGSFHTARCTLKG